MPIYRPAHATVWLRWPLESVRTTRIVRATSTVLALVMVLGTVAGAGAASRTVAAAPVQPPTITSIPDVTARWVGIAASPDVPAPRRPTSPGAAIGSTTPDPTDGAPVVTSVTADGIPSIALAAYRRAAARETVRAPTCHIPWPLLAGIGRIESDHGLYGGAGLHADGLSTPPIIGIPLTGNGTARITDTDHGRLDGDTVFDHAVGPMQFIPSTWAAYGVDASADGVADPFNIYDATAAAADYLCAAGGDLRTSAGQQRALRAYNDSTSYLSIVLSYEAAYASGVPGVTIPTFGPAPGPGARPTLPPVNPGPPAALPHIRRTVTATPPLRPTTSRTTPAASRSTTSATSAPPTTPPTTPPSCPTVSPSTSPSAASGSTNPSATSSCTSTPAAGTKSSAAPTTAPTSTPSGSSSSS